MSLGDRTTWREPGVIERAAQSVTRHARRVSGPSDLDDLVARLADRQFVLVGEASHGTSEFYEWRAALTARLIREHDFDFVAVEGDWTSCYEVNRYLKDFEGAAETPREVLAAFDRWPTWMWANWEMVSFLTWLRDHNAGVDPDDRVGFFGLDVYSLFESMAAVVDYLEDVDPEAAQHARDAYRCFEPYGEDAQEYARSLRLVPESCEEDVLDVLTAIRRNAPSHDGDHPDEYFDAEQNALVAANAEAYYRALVGGHRDSWNVRDEHMVETLNRLVDHHGGDATAVVWAHNTHVGDARATDMASQGRVNVGQLVREQNPADEVGVVGFGTYEGSVVAGDAWDAPMTEMAVPPAERGSYEHVFHRADGVDRLLVTDDVGADDPLATPRGHRAIGVVYHPDFESGNYVPTDLRERYDAYVHLDETRALHPLSLHPEGERVPELYPVGV